MNTKKNPKITNKDLRTIYTEIQVRKFISKHKIDPIGVIAMLLDEQRQEDKIRFAAALNTDVTSLTGMLNITERTYYRRRKKFNIKNVVFKSKINNYV